MPARKVQTLADRLDRLEAVHGPAVPPRTTDPFENILRENVAYLVDDDRREAVFQLLERKVGLEPAALLRTPIAKLAEIIRDGGMRPEMRAEKLHESARLALEIGVEELRRLVKRSPDEAAKALKRFPGIGEPGADRLLLYAKAKRTLGADSNIVRVLTRIGYGEVDENYTRMYRSAARAVEPELPAGFAALLRAHILLRTHGKEICKASVPKCEVCPLTGSCRWYRENGTA